MKRPDTHKSKKYRRALELAQRKSPSLEKVAELLEAAQDEGDSHATYALATWYLHGKFFKRNQARAVKLLKSQNDLLANHPNSHVYK